MFSFLKRTYLKLHTWLQTASRPVDHRTAHQQYGRLVDRVAQVTLTASLSEVRLPQHANTNWAESAEVPRRQTIPRHVRMDTTPRTVLVCAGCGAIAHPWTRKPCHTKNCTSEKRVRDVCTCLFLPLDGDRAQNYRIYRKDCHVHDA